MKPKLRRTQIVCTAVTGILILLILISLTVGSYPLSLKEIANSIGDVF